MYAGPTAGAVSAWSFAGRLWHNPPILDQGANKWLRFIWTRTCYRVCRKSWKASTPNCSIPFSMIRKSASKRCARLATMPRRWRASPIVSRAAVVTSVQCGWRTCASAWRLSPSRLRRTWGPWSIRSTMSLRWSNRCMSRSASASSFNFRRGRAFPKSWPDSCSISCYCIPDSHAVETLPTPVAPNSLLQAAPAAKPQAPAANPPAAAAAPRDKGHGFAHVFASRGAEPSTKTDDNSAKPARDKPADASAKPVAGNDKPVANNYKPAAGTPAVADSGKPLPADPPAKLADSASSDQTPPADPALAQQPAADPVVAPVVDPALIVTVTPVAVPVPVPVETPAPAAAAKDDKAQPVVTAPLAATDVAKPAFDPTADPLDAMPAVRLAMEQGGHVSASSQAPQSAAPPSQDQPTAAQNFATGLANMVDQQASKDSTDQGGDKAFGGLIEGGLKDLKSASSDTRVDDFANRLAALTQAATPKTANALPPVANAPLAMHQSGWTEEVVNRVMYLSSANLKSAEIQLQPAELGRLDIKVNMTADRQAQGQGQQQQNQANGVSGRGGRGDSSDVADHAEVAAAVAPVTSTVIGSSAVDYYA